MKQGGFGGDGSLVLLLLLVLASAADPDDPPFFIAPDVHLALPAAESTGGKLLRESFIMTAEALEDRYKGAEAGAGDHVGRVLVGLQEHGDDDPGDLGFTAPATDEPGPRPDWHYAQLIGGPLDGLLLDITGFTPDEVDIGVALTTELWQLGAAGWALYVPHSANPEQRTRGRHPGPGRACDDRLGTGSQLVLFLPASNGVSY